ncbi:hypothetical protein ACKFKG_03665 [Phormidesmis sp. 146-35]
MKQTVMDAYNRKPLSEQALRLHDITIANDYAIVEGAVEDAIVQFLVRRQQGKWQVVAMELGEPFGEQAGLLAQKVPAATVQKLLSFQKLREVAAIAKREKSCVTIIDDPNPPTNVRSRPTVQANVVGKVLQGLQQVGFRPNDRQTFTSKLSQNPNSPTAKTWAALRR